MASKEEEEEAGGGGGSSSRIFNFELELRAKLNESRSKSAALKKMERELCETRRSLYRTRSQLEDERRSSNQLEMRLKSALIAAKRLEEENIKTRAQEIRTKIKCDNSSIERDAFIYQARIARFENIDLKMKIQEYRTTLLTAKMINETLEASLMEFKNSLTRLHDKFNSNFRKLQEEQDQLKKRHRESIEFGQRIQTVINNCHITRKQQQQNSFVPGTAVDSYTGDDAADILDLHKKMETTLKELRSKLGSNAIEDKLALVCIELRRMDENFAKNFPTCTKTKTTG